jgi:hypothetical protein
MFIFQEGDMTDLDKSLFNCARQQSFNVGYPPELTWESLLGEIAAPNFNSYISWAYHIPEELRGVWDSLSTQAKIVAFCMAQKMHSWRD